MARQSANARTVSARKRLRWDRVVSCVAGTALAILGIVLAAGFFEPGPSMSPRAPALPSPADQRTADELAAMSDAELDALDPLVMDLIVARGIPGLENLDIAWYSGIVDEWAKRIDAANRAAEPDSKDDPTYRVSREFWMAGGMAVMLAGPAFGIRYTIEHIDNGKPEQHFVHGVIQTKMGTCASMPALYMAIGHRLGWPIKAVVSGDHMWARWDDGVPGGQRFNPEATNARSDGGMGSFASLTDEQYADWLKTPPSAIQSGSDFTSLTPRQTLGVYLQSRAGYWAAHEDWHRAEQDLRLAAACFPKNRDIREFLRIAHQDGRSSQWDGYMVRRTPRRDPLEEQARFVERLNRHNEEALRRLFAPPPAVDPLSPWNSDPR